ncbi:MAG: XisH family protein [Nostoc sp.]|uniref:XisH family protein n=1 Tax=Nostoc sp. TaxID=1180 RepID=UPI002FF5992D
MAKDLYHEQVKRALEKDGWQITHDPYELRIGGVEMYIDIGAEQIIGAQRENDKIAVEVKSFISPSRISDFHLAHGQFLDYRYALEDKDPERILYLAVARFVYQTFFNLAFINSVVQRSQIKLLVYDLEKETIEQWIK